MNTEYTQPSQPFDPDRTVQGSSVPKLRSGQSQSMPSAPAAPKPAAPKPSASRPSVSRPSASRPSASIPAPYQSTTPQHRPQAPQNPAYADERTRMAYAQTPQPRTRNSNDRTWLYVIGGIGAFGVFVVMGIIGLFVLNIISTPRFASGTAIGGVDVSGDTVEDARTMLTQQFASKTVTVTDGIEQWQVPLSDIGVTVNVDAMIETAEAASTGVNVPFAYNFDAVQAQNGLVTISDFASIPAIDGNPPKNGVAVEIPVLLDRLENNLDAELADGLIELPMIETFGSQIDDAPYTGVSTKHVVEAGQELGLIAKEYNVSMQSIIDLNAISNPDLLYVGQELEIPAAGIYVPSADEAPAPPTTVGKAIVVSTQNQRIYAYENGELIHSHLTSTGRPQTPTVLGDYKIYVKHVATDMRGPDYFLPQVPYTMYFYQGYGIHGTYWHNNFGRVMSHGCVNLPVDEAQWFFEWAEVGTPVRVV